MPTSPIRTIARAALAVSLGTIVTSCLKPPRHQDMPAPGVPPLAPNEPSTTPGSSWTSTGPFIAPLSDEKHRLVAIKDPTIVRFNERWHVYASTVSNSGTYNMVYLSFADWSEAPQPKAYHMDQTPGFSTYVAAPQLFYFSPRKKWYLVFQSGPPMFSTADDPSDPTKWTPPAPFFAYEPAIVRDNGGWLDFWVICDATYCHLFFSNDKGRWYKSKTPIDAFPYGFKDPVVVMEDAEAGRLFEACNVYKINGTNKYLALIEAFDKSSDYKRYFRSWTAESLEGPWQVQHDDGASPFAGRRNVTFTGAPWTVDISHGEMIRAGYDERMLIEQGHYQYLYQGFDSGVAPTEYNRIPWRLGLLTLR